MGRCMLLFFLFVRLFSSKFEFYFGCFLEGIVMKFNELVIIMIGKGFMLFYESRDIWLERI